MSHHHPLEKPPRPPHMPHFPPHGGMPHKVSTGESWVTVAQKVGIHPRELIHFNFNTTAPAEVNWCLRNIVGCRHATHDGWNYIFTSHDSPGVIFLPQFKKPVASAPSPAAPKVSAATHYAPTTEAPVTGARPEYQPTERWEYAQVFSLSLGELAGGAVYLFAFKNQFIPHGLPVLFIGGGFVAGWKIGGKGLRLDPVKKIGQGLLKQILGKLKVKLDGVWRTLASDYKPLHTMRPFSLFDLSFALGGLASASAGVGSFGISITTFEAQPTSWKDRLALLEPGLFAGEYFMNHPDPTPYFVEYPSGKTMHALSLLTTPGQMAEAGRVGADLVTKGVGAAVADVKKDAHDIWDTLTGGSLSWKKLEIPSLGVAAVGGFWIPLTTDFQLLTDSLAHD